MTSRITISGATNGYVVTTAHETASNCGTVIARSNKVFICSTLQEALEHAIRYYVPTWGQHRWHLTVDPEPDDEVSHAEVETGETDD